MVQGLSKEDQLKKEMAEKEVKKLKEEEKTKENELNTTHEQIEEKQAEFQKLCDDVQMSKNNLQRLMEKLGTNKKDAYLKVIELKCTELQQTQDQLKNTSAELRNLEKELEKSKLKVLELQNSNKPSQEHDNPTVTCQGSVRGPVIVEFDQDRKYVHLRNFSNEEQPMGCWELQIQVDDEQPIIYTFLPSFTLKAEQTVTIWPSNSDVDHNPPTNLVLWKSWDPADKLLATLLCSSGQEMANTKVNVTIEANCDHYS
ncbi:lamin-A-like [Scomber scombrus]|uniref:lamin-A-like n=1 Tax=Scomber scombrus TaxID=13677 RepID=UPI002DDAA1A7|nr:lamin-A-like [Scomber scombrus]